MVDRLSSSRLAGPTTSTWTLSSLRAPSRPIKLQRVSRVTWWYSTTTMSHLQPAINIKTVNAKSRFTKQIAREIKRERVGREENQTNAPERKNTKRRERKTHCCNSPTRAATGSPCNHGNFSLSLLFSSLLIL